MTTDKDQVAAATRALRALHGLTQPQFAELVGIHPSTLRAIEAGTQARAGDYVLRICNAAAVSVTEWLDLLELYRQARERKEQIRVENGGA